MTLLRIGSLACLCALMTPAAVIAQLTGMQFDLQQRAIVQVRTAGAPPGSGLVIGVNEKRLSIVTARHVVEGEQPRRSSDPVGTPETIGKKYPGRECRRAQNRKPTISYKFEKGVEVEALSAFCSDTLDVAVLTVELDAGLLRAIPSFRQPADLSDETGAAVIVLGIPQGANWSRIPNARIVLNNVDNDSLELNAPGVEAGFSGGAVLDRDAGLVGMVVRESNPTAYAVPWSRIADLLRDWLVDANRLEGRPGESNPSFVKVSGIEPAEEGARNAIRQYQSAFANKDLDRMRAVYPNVVRSVKTLFGDSVRNDLNLGACTDIAPLSEAQSNALARRVQNNLNQKDSTPVYSLSCEFSLTIYRRTGPEFAFQSSKFAKTDDAAKKSLGAKPRQPSTSTPDDSVPSEVLPMTFYVKHVPRESLWQIVDIDPVVRPRK